MNGNFITLDVYQRDEDRPALVTGMQDVAFEKKEEEIHEKPKAKTKKKA